MSPVKSVGLEEHFVIPGLLEAWESCRRIVMTWLSAPQPKATPGAGWPELQSDDGVPIRADAFFPADFDASSGRPAAEKPEACASRQVGVFSYHEYAQGDGLVSTSVTSAPGRNPAACPALGSPPPAGDAEPRWSPGRGILPAAKPPQLVRERGSVSFLQ